MKLLIFVLLFTPAIASAQIYKCETPDGIIFSDQECGSDAAVVQVEDTSGVSGGVSDSVQIELAEKRLNREQNKYVGRLYSRRNQELASIDRQIRSLRKQKTSANNNLAGATYGAGIDQQIGALQASRAQVQSSYQEQITQAELSGN